MDEINHFVQEKQNWINKTIQRHKEEAINNKAPEYKTSEKFYYLGQSYPLEVFFEPFDTAGVFFWNNCFYLNAQENRNLRKHYFSHGIRKKHGNIFVNVLIFSAGSLICIMETLR
jgi:predicted metal-dependent hydrolase